MLFHLLFNSMMLGSAGCGAWTESYRAPDVAENLAAGIPSHEALGPMWQRDEVTKPRRLHRLRKRFEAHFGFCVVRMYQQMLPARAS